MHRKALNAPKGPTMLLEEKQQWNTDPVATGHQLGQGAAPGLYPVRVGSHPAEGATGPAAATSPVQKGDAISEEAIQWRRTPRRKKLHSQEMQQALRECRSHRRRRRDVQRRIRRRFINRKHIKRPRRVHLPDHGTCSCTWKLTLGLPTAGLLLPVAISALRCLQRTVRDTLHTTHRNKSAETRDTRKANSQAFKSARRHPGATKSSDPVTRAVSSEVPQVQTGHIYIYTVSCHSRRTRLHWKNPKPRPLRHFQQPPRALQLTAPGATVL